MNNVLKNKKSTPPNLTPLRDYVEKSLQHYFVQLDGHEPSNLHALVLDAIEAPLLKIVMQRCADNQTRAAHALGMSRSTLRKKLKQYKII